METDEMVYVMSPEHSRPAFPSTEYYGGIKAGFLQNDIPTRTLEAALAETRRRIEKTKGGKRNEQIAFQ